MQSDNKDNKLADVLTEKEQKLLPLGKSLKQHVQDKPGKSVTDPSMPDKSNFADILFHVKEFVEIEFPKVEASMLNLIRQDSQRDLALQTVANMMRHLLK